MGMRKPGTNENNVEMTDVLCDFCQREWSEDIPMVEGHQGSCVCGNCLSKNNVWIRASGKGTIYSFSVVHQTPGPAFRLDVPFTLAFVELEEGVRIMTNIIDVDPRSVYIGMPVQVTWDRRDDVAIPMFKPVTPRE